MTPFLPNLFLVGAAKSGTTTLHHYLKSFPDICMSIPKEPFFFEAYFEKGIGFYKKHYFKHWNGEKLIGESRHRNLYLPYVPERIHSFNPDAKIVAILRNPVTRAYSHWYHHYSMLSEELPFEKAIRADLERIGKGLKCDTPEEIKNHIKGLAPRYWEKGEIGLGLYRTYIDTGYYLEQLQRYYKLFPAENIHVIIFEDMKTDYRSVIEKLAVFLDTKPDENTFKEKWINKQYKKSYHKRWELLLWKYLPFTDPYQFPDRLKEELHHHFEERNKALASFLNVNLDHWNNF